MKLLFLFLNPEIRTGGHRRYLFLAESLENKGHETTVLVNDACENLPNLKNQISMTVNDKLKPKNLSLLYHTVKERKKLKQCHPDWIIIHGERHFPAAVFLSYYLRSPIQFSLRCDTVESFKIDLQGEKKLSGKIKLHYMIFKDQIFETINLIFSKQVLLQSHLDYNNFLKRHHIFKDKCSIIPGNINREKYDPQDENINMSASLKNVLYVGNISTIKGIEILLECALNLQKNNSNIRITIAGIGPREAYMKEFIEKNTLKNINYIGFCSTVFALYKEHDILVIPSQFDSFPDVPLEAFYAGIPVMAAKTGGLPEILESEELLFTRGDGSELAQKLMELEKDPHQYKNVRMLSAARKKAFDFDWTSAYEEKLQANQH